MRKKTSNGIWIAIMLVSIMLAFMWSAKTINLKQFSNLGAVRDFSKEEMERFGDKIYIGTAKEWNYLYLDIDGEKNIQAKLIQYGSDGKKVFKQDIVLFVGANFYELPDDVKMTYFKVVLNDDESVNVKEMQLRMAPQRLMLWPYILTVMFFGILFGSIYVGITWFQPERFRYHVDDGLIRVQYIYGFLGERGAWKLSKEIGRGNLGIYRRILLCVLFLGNFFVQIVRWNARETAEYYYLLAVGAGMIAIGLGTWEQRWKYEAWNLKIAGVWFAIWTMIVISKIFAPTSQKEIGIIMLLSGAFFMCAWNNMRMPRQLMTDLMISLEIVFFVIVLCFMICAPMAEKVAENNSFSTAEGISMYSVLMTAVFMEGIYEHLTREQCGWGYEIMIVTGIFLTVMYTISAGNVIGWIALTLTVTIFVYTIWKARKRAKLRFVCIVAAALCACVIYLLTMWIFETLYVPVIDINAIQKNYVFGMGVFGNSSRPGVFSNEENVYNGYLDIAYRNGFFILLPYLLLQIGMMQKGCKKLLQKTIDGMDVFVFAVLLIFLCFCIKGNIEGNYLHPLWGVFYLGCGYWFKKDTGYGR